MEKIVSGIVVELVELGMEEIRKKIKNRNNPKSKKRRTRKKNS